MANDVYLTQIVPFGLRGLDLKRTIDLIPSDKCAILKNVDRTEEGRFKLRKGQTQIGKVFVPVPPPPPPVDEQYLYIDIPIDQAEVVFPFFFGGWAIDLRATPAQGCGISFVHVWLWPLGSAGKPEDATFLGQYPVHVERPGVAAVHGDQFLVSGFDGIIEGWILGKPIVAGVSYEMVVYGWSVVDLSFATESSVWITFLASYPNPLDPTYDYLPIPTEGDAPFQVPPVIGKDHGAQGQWVPAVPSVESVVMIQDEPTTIDVPPALLIRSGLKCMAVDELPGEDEDDRSRRLFSARNADEFYDGIQQLGASMVRVPLDHWGDGDPVNIALDRAYYEAIVNEFTRRGIGVLLTIGPGVISEYSDWTAERTRDQFAMRVVDILSATKITDHVEWVEIWPEPDGSNAMTAAHYADLWYRVRSALDVHSLSYGLILGTITGIKDDVSYLEAIYTDARTLAYKSQNGVFPWDAVGLAVVDVPIDQPDCIAIALWRWGIGNVRQVLREKNDSARPIWITKIGWADVSVGETLQASLVYNAFEHLDGLEDPDYVAAGEIVERAFYWNYQDSTYGLLDEDGRQKRSWIYYRLLGTDVAAPVAAVVEAITDQEAFAKKNWTPVPPPPPPPPATGAAVNTLFRLDDPRTGNFARIVGVGGDIYMGKRGDIPRVDTGFHDSPSHVTAARPALSGEPWAFVANYQRMKKFRIDGLNLALGLPAPGEPATAHLGDEYRTDIDSFDSTHGWENPKGIGPFDLDVKHTRVEGVVGHAVRFQMTGPEIDPEEWEEGNVSPVNWAFWTKAIPLDLSHVGHRKVRKATDDDIIHVRIRPELPDRIVDIKLYFVVNAPFVGGRFGLPGTSAEEHTANTDAYVKTFRPHDFQGVIAMEQTPREATADAVASEQAVEHLDRDRQERRGRHTDPGAEVRQAGRDKSRGVAEELAVGRVTWTEFGVIDVPLRRGDFLRIGQDDKRDWRHVTGIVIAVSMDVRKDVQNHTDVDFDDMYLSGGYNIDNMEFGADHYDWRYINYDPRTGDKSNPSKIMSENSRVDTPRREVIVEPRPYGNPAIRQRFYRRGGSLINDWYYCGENTGDGAEFHDTFGDLEIVAAGTLELDNDRAVTTVDASGKTIYGQPLPSIWGPVQDLLFACGDPYRPGHLYYSKVGEYDSWPAAHNIEVTSPSEELMAGFVYGNDTYVFSRKRLYQIFPGLAGSAANVNYTPTECMHGLIHRHAFCVGYGGIYFASDDGIYFTRGGLEINISDEDIEGIFKVEKRRGLPEVRPNSIRLEVHENQLWFIYRGRGAGTPPNILIYDLLLKYWRQYDFVDNPAVVLSERQLLSTPNLLVMGTHGGLIQTLEGETDNDAPIIGHVRTGALDQGAPRREKVYGDLSLDAALSSGWYPITTTLTVTIWKNNEASRHKILTLVAGTASPADVRDLLQYRVSPETWNALHRQSAIFSSELFEIDETKDRYTLDVLALRAKNISVELEWSTPSFELYFGSLQYLMDEAIARIRWDSEEINHGVPGAQTPLYAKISIRALSDVTLTMTTYREDGTATNKTYTIESTESVKLTRFVPFEPTKGVLFKYVFTSDEVFKIYREESIVIVRAWGGAEVPSQPFGDLLTVSSAEIGSVRGVQ